MQMRLILILVLSLLAGCAGQPYLEVGLGYQVNAASGWACASPYQGNFEVGVEYERFTVGYNHQSHALCGAPFNNKAESWTDDVRITYKFGGIK